MVGGVEMVQVFDERAVVVRVAAEHEGESRLLVRFCLVGAHPTVREGGPLMAGILVADEDDALRAGSKPSLPWYAAINHRAHHALGYDTFSDSCSAESPTGC